MVKRSMDEAWDRRTNEARVERDWSHDALHHARWGHDYPHHSDYWKEECGLGWQDAGRARRRYPFSLGLPAHHPQDKVVVVSLGSLTADELAEFTDPDRACWRVHLIANFDWVDAEANSANAAGLEFASARQEKAERLEEALMRELTVVLTGFLAERAGQRLDHRELRLFLQLAARLINPKRQTYVDGWQVCEWCDRVFVPKQSNARRCEGCRRKRAPKMRPAHLGGVHLATYGDPADDTVLYLGRCEECGRSFNSRDGRQRLCAEHGTNAARQQRFRARRRKPS
jgi:hypothetical protein